MSPLRCHGLSGLAHSASGMMPSTSVQFVVHLTG